MAAALLKILEVLGTQIEAHPELLTEVFQVINNLLELCKSNPDFAKGLVAALPKQAA